MHSVGFLLSVQLGPHGLQCYSKLYTKVDIVIMLRDIEIGPSGVCMSSAPLAFPLHVTNIVICRFLIL